MMRLPPFRYLAPRTAREAARILADHGAEAMAVAGGTDLYPNMKRRQFEPKVAGRLARPRRGARDHANGGLRLGAMATLTEVAEHPGVLAAVAGRWPAPASSRPRPAAQRGDDRRQPLRGHSLQLLQPVGVLARRRSATA